MRHLDFSKMELFDSESEPHTIFALDEPEACENHDDCVAEYRVVAQDARYPTPWIVCRELLEDKLRDPEPDVIELVDQSA